MVAGNQQKHLEFTFSIKALSFHSWTSRPAQNISSNSWNGYTAENRRGETCFHRDSIPILVSRTVKNRKFKLLYFRNETCYGNGILYKDLLFVYLQPSLNQNSLNPAIVTLQFDDVTVKTIYWKFYLSVRSVAKKDDTSPTHPWVTSRKATLGRSLNLALSAVLIKLVNKTIGQIVWQLRNQSNQSSFVWIRLISTIE